MKNIYLIIILGQIFNSSYVECRYIITFFFKSNLSMQHEKKSIEKLQHDINIPGKVGRKWIKHMLNDPNPQFLQSIFCSYAGYLTTANHNGQVIFPKEQAKSNLHILVTQRIQPIMMIGKTVHHWQLDYQQQAQLFKCTQIKDEHSKKICWHITEKDMPENHIISLDTIIIFAKPKYIKITPGIYSAKKTRNIYLPDIFVDPNIQSTKQALWVLNVRNFFKFVDPNIKQASPNYRSLKVAHA